MRMTVLCIASCFHVQDITVFILEPRKSEERNPLTLANTIPNLILPQYNVKTFFEKSEKKFEKLSMRFEREVYVSHWLLLYSCLNHKEIGFNCL